MNLQSKKLFLVHFYLNIVHGQKLLGNGLGFSPLVRAVQQCFICWLKPWPQAVVSSKLIQPVFYPWEALDLAILNHGCFEQYHCLWIASSFKPLATSLSLHPLSNNLSLECDQQSQLTLKKSIYNRTFTSEKKYLVQLITF